MVKNKRIYIHGVGIDELTQHQAADRIEGLLSRPSQKAAAIFTPNAEMIYRASRDSSLVRLLNGGDLNTADGVGTVWAADVLGTPLPQRIAGIDLGETALRIAAEGGRTVFLLGGRQGVAERAANRLRSRYPTLDVIGTHHGYFEPSGPEHRALIEELRLKKPDLLIVCLGFPRQEEWITANRPLLEGVKIMMGLGGSLDVWSGDVRRAPRLLQGLGLEWLWRTVGSPRRIMRSAALPAFALMTLRRAAGHNKRK